MTTHIEWAPAPADPHDVITCPYCTAQVATASFAPLSPHGPLVSAQCTCGRTLTMATVTLERRTIHLP